MLTVVRRRPDERRVAWSVEGSMWRSTVIAATVVVVALTTVTAAPRGKDEKKAAVLLQAAQAKETLEGDLKGAIALYEQAATEAGTNRALVARALLASGVAQQKLGSGDASAVFARIVREFTEPRGGRRRCPNAARRAGSTDEPVSHDRADRPNGSAGEPTGRSGCPRRGRRQSRWQPVRLH